MRFSLTDMGIFELCGGGRTGYGLQNRNGKSLVMAIGAYYAEEQGMDVYCNCPISPLTEQPDHILNIPHYDYDPYGILDEDLRDCYVMTDQGEQVMDARVCARKEVRNLTYFAYQAKKRGIAWRYDTPRHKNIDPRIRRGGVPDAWIYPERIPPNWHEPLQKIRLIVDLAVPDRRFILKINNPSDYFPIYNSDVMLRPYEHT